MMIPASHSEHRAEGASAPFASSDIPFEIARLQASAAHETEGHAGRTLTKFPELRVVLEAMKAGTRLAFHEPAEQLTLQVLLGRLRVRMGHEYSDLSEGSFAAVDAELVHEVEALQDCAFLLTLAWPPMRSDAASEKEEDGAGI